MTTRCNCDKTSSYSSINAERSVDAFRQESLRRARLLYPSSKQGRLFIELDKESATGCATALISEHRPAESRQYSLDLKRGERVFRELPAGGYTIVVREPGFEPHRAYVEVAQNQDVGISARLEKKAKTAASFSERIAQYGIQLNGAEPGDLNVEAGTRLDLGTNTRAALKPSHSVTLASIEDAKRVIGQPDHFFPSDQPRYGKMVGAPTGVSAADDEMNLLFDTRFALREYIYGNSKSVIDWKDDLDAVLAASPIIIPIWLYLTVTVGPHAVLNIGAAGLVCNELRVHYTGKVRVSGGGPTVLETGIYEQFGWWEVPVIGLSDQAAALAATQGK